jgi:hypothetical protein
MRKVKVDQGGASSCAGNLPIEKLCVRNSGQDDLDDMQAVHALPKMRYPFAFSN